MGLGEGQNFLNWCQDRDACGANVWNASAERLVGLVRAVGWYSGRALAGSRTFQIPLLYITVSLSLAVHFLTPTYINIQRHVLVCSFK